MKNYEDQKSEKIKSLRDLIAFIIYGIFRFLWNILVFFKEAYRNFAELFKQVYDYFAIHLYTVEKFHPRRYTLEECKRKARDVMNEELQMGISNEDRLANAILNESRARANRQKLDEQGPDADVRSDYAEDELDIKGDDRVISMYSFKKGSEKVGFKAMKIEWRDANPDNEVLGFLLFVNISTFWFFYFLNATFWLSKF